MEVVIYRAKGPGGYLYDISMNPGIDYEILKKTRKIEEMNIISTEIPFSVGESFLKSIYGKSSMLGKFITSEEYFLTNIFRKHGINKIDVKVSEPGYFPSLDDISRVEEFIVGRIVSLNNLYGVRGQMGVKHHSIEDILQALYCERRIRMVPAVKRVKNKHICLLCDRQMCSKCCYGFNEDDILLYAADNYNLDVPPSIEFKKKRYNEIIKGAHDSFTAFVKSRKETAILWVAPHAFEYDILTSGIFEIIRRGGKVLYISSNSLIYDVRETMRRVLEGARIEIVNGVLPKFRELDISICSYIDYPCFYKAFDLVIYDERHSFVDMPGGTMLSLAKRAAKEKGKFLNISSAPDRERRSIFKAQPEMIEVPVSFTKSPIPEPRIITSRFLEGTEVFIPPMAMDVIKWSLHESMRTIIFVPDENKLDDVYRYLTEIEGIDETIIDLSTEKNKNALMAFKKGDCSIILSYDFRDSLHLMEDVNVIVMYSHNAVYRVDTLVNMAAMATMHGKKSLAEVVFVAQAESEEMTLAKSIIRGVNKIAWEKGYINH